MILRYFISFFPGSENVITKLNKLQNERRFIDYSIVYSPSLPSYVSLQLLGTSKHRKKANFQRTFLQDQCFLKATSTDYSVRPYVPLFEMPVGSLKAFCSFEHLFLLVFVFSIANFAVMTHKNNDNISHAVSLSYFESCYHKILHIFSRRIYRTAAGLLFHVHVFDATT